MNKYLRGAFYLLWLGMALIIACGPAYPRAIPIIETPVQPSVTASSSAATPTANSVPTSTVPPSLSPTKQPVFLITPAQTLTATAVAGPPYGCPGRTQAGPDIQGPGEIRGIVCGLAPGDQAVLEVSWQELSMYNANPSPDKIRVAQATLDNGQWQFSGLEVGPGEINVTARALSGAYVRMPDMGFGAPQRGITWRFDAPDIRFETLEQFTTTHGMSPCLDPVPAYRPSSTPPSPNAPVAQCMAIGSAVSGPENSIAGKLSGLGPSGKATVSIYPVPKVAGGCYDLVGSFTTPPACRTPLPPDALQTVPAVTPDQLVARFAIQGDVWGLASGVLRVGRYLVVVDAPGFTALPLAYSVDVPGNWMVSSDVRGLDFSFTQSGG